MSPTVAWRHLGVRHATPRAAIGEGLRLLDEAAPDDPPSAVWWDVAEPALVVSRGSRVSPDEAACAAAGVRVVRRGSGGGPVLWTEDLVALDVVIPRGHRLWSQDVVDSYRWLGGALAAALTGLGLTGAAAVEPADARARNDPAAAALACYAGISPWEVLAGPRKLAGLSQIRRRGGILLQVGIPRLPQTPLVDLLRLDPPTRDALRRTLTDRTAGGEPMPATTTIRAAVDAAIAAV